MKLYTLENDYLFKKIFSNELYLKQLLLDLFDVKANNIMYLNTTLLKSNKNGKAVIVDLLLEVDGEIVILELQNLDRHNFKDRLLFYSSNIIANYCLKEGDNYNNLKSIKVYAIINYSLFDDEVKNIVRLKRKNKIFTKKLEYQIFNLTKVDKNNKRNKYYELVNLFNCENIDKLEKILKNKIYKEILKEIKDYNLNSKEYDKMEDIEKMMMNETEHYENAYIDGIEVGIERGISQGKKVRNKDIAKNMLADNIDILLISKYTNLSVKEIESLK